MSERRWDGELDELLAAAPEDRRIARLLQAGRLRPAPLDPRFKQDLRRKLMDEAFERLPRRVPPWSRLFGGPGMALAAAAVGCFLLVAALYVLHAGTGTSNQNVYIDNTKPVAVDETVTLRFNQPVDHQAVEQSIQIQPATQVAYTWNGNDLTITPRDGSFAGNTQYHVIVPAAAAGAARPADLTFQTLPAPSPSPVRPPPAPPSLAIVSNTAVGPALGLVGWTPQHQLVYLSAAGGDLDLVAADGSGKRTLASGVTFAALSPDGSQVLLATTRKDVEQVPVAGGAQQSLAQADVLGVYWLGARPAYRTDAGLFAADGTRLLALPAGVTAFAISPDGTRAVYQVGQTAVVGWTVVQADLATGSVHTWPQQGLGIVWSPDSAQVAYGSASGIFVSAPAGTSARQILGSSGEPRWADARTLFVSSNDGTFLVGSDGSSKVQLASAPVGSGAVFDGSSTLALVADGNANILKLGPATGLDLQAGSTVVKAFEDARVAGDATGAGRQLDASAARGAPPLVASGQPRLSRWFPVSAQAVANNPASLRYVVRLIYTRDRADVRSQDETLTLVAGSGGGLVIDSVSDAPAVAVGGPQVIGVQVLAGKVVVSFDSDLDPGSVSGAFHILGSDGKEVSAQSSYAARTVTLTVSLAPGKHYTLVVDTSVSDVANTQLQQEYRQDLFAPPSTASPGA